MRIAYETPSPSAVVNLVYNSYFKSNILSPILFGDIEMRILVDDCLFGHT